ncbi:hypothetical protein EIP86_004069 [Pleurotus ostreatoroseus]|nr:hypothetical protein EIP86_004069 [Pleurotus ostreatoroseus]
MVKKDEKQPDLQEGIEYWTSQPASYNGVLGGFGEGSLPRIDALGSRQFLQFILPNLCSVASAVRLLTPSPPSHGKRLRALDVGAGVGRVTSDTLLPLFDDVVLVEPVEPFVREALARARASKNGTVAADAPYAPWRGIREQTKSVTIIQGTLQSLDPAHPASGECKRLGRVGYVPLETDSGFDVIWCQWCLGHLSDEELVAFFRRCHAALRNKDEGLIVVKENLCQDGDDGSARVSFDEADSSLTRSDAAWKKTFVKAGLTLIYEQLQLGFPEGLYDVKMYALR